jgi:hypothetical protein
LPRVFISHAAADAELARIVADTLKAGTPPLNTFLSSRPGDIRADAQWMHAVEAALLDSDAFLILLTPNSIGRPWVAFETGCAWFANRTVILARTSNLPAEDVPWPLGSRQLYRLDQPDELAVICHALGTRIPDPPATAASIRSQQPTPFAGLTEHAWEGLTFGGQYYAWAGPLLQLEDREPAPCPPGLVEELRSRGLSVRLGRTDKLDNYIGRGRAQVFATDAREWRRPIQQDGQFLLVGGLATADGQK